MSSLHWRGEVRPIRDRWSASARLSCRQCCSILGGCFLLFCLAVLAGCSGRPKTVAVSGVVTYKGQPVKNASVLFMPVAGGRPASGQTGEDGSFKLTTFVPGDGAIPGDYMVGVRAVEGEGDTDPDNPKPAAKLKWLVPEKFSEPQGSGLTATVAKGKEIRIEIP